MNLMNNLRICVARQLTAGLQQVCALLINHLVALEDRGEFKGLLDRRSVSQLEGDATNFFQISN